MRLLCSFGENKKCIKQKSYFSKKYKEIQCLRSRNERIKLYNNRMSDYRMSLCCISLYIIGVLKGE